jgi:hypothetical protein
MTTSSSPDGSRISRRVLFQAAGALGLSAAGSTWSRPATAVAAAANGHGAAQLPLLSAGHLVTRYLPSQPTGWPPQGGRLRNGVGVTIGGHIASAPFTIHGTPYEVSLVSFGQPGKAPNPVYEAEPSDSTIDFKHTLKKAWGAYYSFRYVGGFSGRTAISVQSYSVAVTEPPASHSELTGTHPQITYGCDLFLVYQPDQASSDPPITADLRWIEVTHAGGRSSTEFAQRGNPYYFPGGLTSVYGKPACSFYGGGEGGIATKATTTGGGPAFSSLATAESFLVLDTRRTDHAGKGIIDVLGGVKWGWQVQPVHAS